MSAPDVNSVEGACEQSTVHVVDNIASSAGTLSTSSSQQVTTHSYDALVGPTEVVTTISSSTSAATIDGEMNVDQATVALSFSNDAGDEVVDHAFALQFDTLTGSGQPNELYESSPFTSDVAPSPEPQVENNQTNQDQPQEDRLFQDNVSPRSTKNIDVMDATTITMSSPTIQAVQPQPPNTQTAPPLKPRQAIKVKKTQVPQHQIQLQSQHPIAPEQSPQALPTPQRKSPRRHIPTKGTGVVKKGTKRRHASTTTPSPTTENLTTGGTTTLSSQVFSWNDILRVQNLIERCLQQCLSKDEIVATLQAQASVDPAFTAVIWQKLEEQNPSFFKAYTLQLQLKDQVVAFNYLMTQQKDMMAKSLSIDSRSSGYARHGGMSARNLGAPSRLGSSGHKAQQKLQQQRQQSQQQQSMSNEDNTCSNPLNVPSSSFHQSTFNPSSLPLPSPIKTDLDTHAFFT